MPRPDAAQTRQRLLDSGAELAGTKSLATLTVDEVVAHAGCAKGTFFTHFQTRAEFFVALHRAFHERVATSVQGAIAGSEPGLPRLLRGSLAYLDACRREHTVKSLLVEARWLPEISAEVHRQNARFDSLATVNFEAARWPSPKQAARLWVALVAEAALAEAEASRRLPAFRRQLPIFLGVEPDSAATD